MGGTQTVGRLVGPVLAGLLVGALLPGVAAASSDLPPGGTFVDDDRSVHEGNIEAIAARDVTRGCDPPSNTHFCPVASVTRGEMAAFLRRALELDASPQDHFGDDDGTTFEADINALAHAGITKGCNPPDNDQFCPGGQVTRGEMAAFLKRAFRYGSASTDHFEDDDGHLFEADINAIAGAGVTKGCNPPANDRYCPDAVVARGEMASFLARGLEWTPVELPSKLDLLEDFALACSDSVPQYCRADGEWPAGERFYIRHSWVLPEEHTPEEQRGFEADGTEFRLYVNGTRQQLEHAYVDVGDELERRWTIDLPEGMEPGTSELLGQWWFDGELVIEVDASIEFG